MITTILFVWIPILIAILGIGISLKAFAAKKNIGFLLLIFVFAKPILEQITWWLYKANFVQTKIATDTWTAPVRCNDVCEPFFSLVLLTAVWLLYKRYSITQTEQ